MPPASPALTAVKVAHTIVWALFAGFIVAIPLVSWRGGHRLAAWLAAIILVEVIVLALNRWRCPLTSLAARYTDDRRHNFDIFLPEWLARHNKVDLWRPLFRGRCVRAGLVGPRPGLARQTRGSVIAIGGGQSR